MSEAAPEPTPGEIVAFWRDAGYQKWFAGGEAFDAVCRVRFHDLHFAAARGECRRWLDSAEGALAAVLLLDQIPRNIFRHSAHSYATDPLALAYAARAIAAGHDSAFEPALRGFFYLPYEHSEAMVDQDRSVALFQALGEEKYLDYTRQHRELIVRFGRFPHRNAALGRENTREEQAWLNAGGGFSG